jgi:hypothetical protein
MSPRRFRARFLACELAAVALVGCASTPTERSADDFADTVLVQQHPDGTTVISTVNPPLRIGGVLDPDLEQHSIRAQINRRTGQKRFELFELISYKGDKAKGFDSAQLRSPDGAEHAALTVLNRERRCAEYRSGPVCTQLEYLSVALDESLLQAIGEDGRRTWSVEFTTRSGEEYVVRILTAEVRGLLKEVHKRTYP